MATGSGDAPKEVIRASEAQPGLAFASLVRDGKVDVRLCQRHLDDVRERAWLRSTECWIFSCCFETFIFQK